ncbi:hypothetical protein Ancab_037226 [Ancistrocladus abbreviatus]
MAESGNVFYKMEKCWKFIREESMFIQLLKSSVSLSKLDDFTLIKGLVTPPAAMVAKKDGENASQLKLIKAAPDVFVPSASVLALILVKLEKNTTPKYEIMINDGIL